MLTVAEAAARLGISASSVRHYEKQFDLRFARTKGGQRLLTERDLENLRIIRSFREQNVPIEDIRQQLTLSDHELDEARPAVEDVIAALVARQDELERIVKSQQTLLNQLLGDSQRLALAHEQVQLLLEAPRETDPMVAQLALQLAAIENQQDQELRELQAYVEALAAEVRDRQDVPPAEDAGPDSTSQDEVSAELEAEIEVVQGRLAALEAEIKARSDSDGEAALIATLRDKLQDLAEELAVRTRTQEMEQIRGLQRRMLELEAAMATREESPTRDEEGLLETLVDAIQADARRRRPWWRFWERG